jgi:copper chaperone CopZ
MEIKQAIEILKNFQELGSDFLSASYCAEDINKAIKVVIETVELKLMNQKIFSNKIDFKAIEEKLEKAFEAETPETFKKWLDDYYKRVNKKILPEVGYWYHIYGRGIYKCVSNELDWFTFINYAGGVFTENYDFDFSNFKLMDYKPYNKN